MLPVPLGESGLLGYPLGALPATGAGPQLSHVRARGPDVEPRSENPFSQHCLLSGPSHPHDLPGPATLSCRTSPWEGRVCFCPLCLACAQTTLSYLSSLKVGPDVRLEAFLPSPGFSSVLSELDAPRSLCTQLHGHSSCSRLGQLADQMISFTRKGFVSSVELCRSKSWILTS